MAWIWNAFWRSKADVAKEAEISYLHVYGQGVWHDSVLIVGNRKALLTLRATIDKALKRSGAQTSDTVFAGDGEGYNALITRCDNERLWPQLAAPYTDEIAQDSGDALNPWRL